MKQQHGRSPQRQALDSSRLSVRVASTAPEIGVAALGPIALTEVPKIGGRPRKLDAAQTQRLFRWLDGKGPGHYGFDAALWTRADLGALIEQRLGVVLSVASIGAVLERLGVTPKKPLESARENDPKALARWELQTYPTIVREARADKAKTCFWEVLPLPDGPAERGGLVSVVAPGGGLWFGTFQGDLDDAVFVALLRKLVRGTPTPLHLILEDRPAYRTDAVRSFLAKASGKLKLHLLPDASTHVEAHPSSRSAKRTRVLDAAAWTLNRRGISQTSFAEIARSVGVSRAALYYYFEDQEDLLFQCYRRTCEEMARCLNEAARRAPDTLAVIDGFIEGLLGEGRPEVAALGEAAFLRESQRNTILGLYEGIVAHLAHLLDEGAHRGVVRPCRSTLVASTIVGLISWVNTVRRWRTADGLSMSDLIDTVKRLLRDGIGVDRSAPVPYAAFVLTPPDLPVVRVFDAQAMGAARQEALLAAASWLFNLKGVDATSLEEIALRVGVTKRVIYHNTGDKQTLVTQCYLRAFRFHESVSQRVRAFNGSRLEAFCAGIHALAEACLREDIAPLRLLTGDEALPADEYEQLQTQVKRLTDAYVDTVRMGQVEGSMRELNARAAVTLFPGFVEWLPKWLVVSDATERASVARELTDLYQRGLRPV